MKDPLNKVWAHQKDYIIALSELREQQGWQNNTLPSPHELNAYQQKTDKLLKNLETELVDALYRLGKTPTDDPHDLLLAIKKNLLNLLKEDHTSQQKNHLSNVYDALPVGALRLYNNEFGPFDSSIIRHTWKACTQENEGTLDIPGYGSLYIPNLDDRFLAGASSPQEVGATGGAKAIQLTEAQMPQHGHNYTHYHSMNFTGDKESRAILLTREFGEIPRMGWVGTTGGNVKVTTRLDFTGTVLQEHAKVKGRTGGPSSRYSSSIGSSGSFSKIPQYHKQLYIIKTANHYMSPAQDNFNKRGKTPEARTSKE